jgi:hypothetical protein
MYTIKKNSVAYKNGNPNTGVSICIPRVFNNINEQRIKQIFIKKNFGFIERVDLIPVRNKEYNRAFIHFRPKSWNMRSADARKFLTALQNGEECAIHYDEPWYWKVMLSNSSRPTKAFDPKKPMRRKERLDLSEETPSTPKAKSVTFMLPPQLIRKQFDVHSMREKIKEEVTDVITKKKFNLNDPIQARMANQY